MGCSSDSLRGGVCPTTSTWSPPVTALSLCMCVCMLGAMRSLGCSCLGVSIFLCMFQEWPRQTKPKKGQFMNFSQGHSGTKVQCESCLFSQGKTPEFTKMGEIHELLVLALFLVWFAGATPECFFVESGVGRIKRRLSVGTFPSGSQTRICFDVGWIFWGTGPVTGGCFGTLGATVPQNDSLKAKGGPWAPLPLM